MPQPVIDIARLRSLYKDVIGGGAPAVAAPAPEAVIDDKTFSDMILNDLPSKIRTAEALIGGGDIEGGRKALASVEDFTGKHRDRLVEFAGFKGSHPVGKLIAANSMELLGRSYMDKLTPMMQAPEIQRKAIAIKIAASGGSKEMEEYAAAATLDGDGKAGSVLSVFGQGAPAWKAGKQAQDAVGQPIPDAAPDVDGFKYFKRTEPILRQAPAKVIESLGELGLIKAAKTAFDAGDAYTGGAFARMGVRAASDASLDPLAAANAFSVTTDLALDAVRAAGATGDPVKTKTVSAALERLQDALPGAGMAKNRAQVTQAAASAVARASEARSLGVELGDDAVAALAHVDFMRSNRPQETMTGESGRISRLLQDANVIAGNVRAQASAGPDGKPIPEAAGYSMFAGLVRQNVKASFYAATAGGSQVKDELLKRAPAFAEMFSQLGLDAETSKASATLLTQALAAGQELDFSKLPAELAKQPAIREFVSAANRKQLDGEATSKPAAGQSFRDQFTTSVERKYLASEPRVTAGGAAVPPETVANNARNKALSDPGVQLVSALDAIDPASRVMSLRPGPGDKLATEDALTKSLVGTVPAVAFEESPMWEYLFQKVPSADLGKKDVRDQATELLVKSYMDRAGIIAKGSSREGLYAVARGHASAVIESLKEELATRGVSGRPAVDIVGLNKELQAKMARGALRPAVGGAGLADPGRNPETADSVARKLGDAFLKDIPVPEDGRRGFAVLAKEKVFNLATLAGTPAPEGGAAPETSFIDPTQFKGGSAGVKSAYEGLKKVDKILGAPVRDKLVGEFIRTTLPRMVERAGLPPSMILRSFAVAKQMDEQGLGIDDIMASAEASFGAIEKRLAQEKLDAEMAKLAMKNGAGVLSTPAESAPEAK